jgi:hypothetical protein
MHVDTANNPLHGSNSTHFQLGFWGVYHLFLSQSAFFSLHTNMCLCHRLITHILCIWTVL